MCPCSLFPTTLRWWVFVSNTHPVLHPSSSSLPPPSLLLRINHHYSNWVRICPSATWASKPLLVIWCSFNTGVPRGGGAARASRRHRQPGIETSPPPATWASESVHSRVLFAILASQGGRPSAKETTPAWDTNLPPAAWTLKPKLFLRGPSANWDRNNPSAAYASQYML